MRNVDGPNLPKVTTVFSLTSPSGSFKLLKIILTIPESSAKSTGLLCNDFTAVLLTFPFLSLNKPDRTFAAL